MLRASQEAATVQSVHVPIKLLTDEERKANDEVMRALAAGISPRDLRRAERTIDGEGTQDAGGSVLDELDRKLRRQAELNEAQIKIADAEFQSLAVKWSDKTLPANERHRVRNIDLRVVDESVPIIKTPDGRIIVDPDMMRCFVCKTWHHRSKMTLGKGPLDKRREDEIIERDGHKFIHETVVHFSRKMSACPECCLAIKPTVKRDGTLVNNVVFPETRG